MDALWGTPLVRARARKDATIERRRTTTRTSPAHDGLQQRGFYNMTRDVVRAIHVMDDRLRPRRTSTVCTTCGPRATATTTSRCSARWPTGGYTKALLCWGQNPAVTEPNQSAVRDGLENLDTARRRRHVRDGDRGLQAQGRRRHLPDPRVLARRRRPVASRTPLARCSGASRPRRRRATRKADIELLLRLAYALDKPAVGRVLAHQGRVDRQGLQLHERVRLRCTATASAGRPRARPRSRTSTFSDALHAGLDRHVRRAVRCRRHAQRLRGHLRADLPRDDGAASRPAARCGSTPAATTTDLRRATIHPSIGSMRLAGLQPREEPRQPQTAWPSPAPRRIGGWGYSWLVNRRVFYNNGDIPGDVADYFMGPDSCSRLFVSTNSSDAELLALVPHDPQAGRHARRVPAGRPAFRRTASASRSASPPRRTSCPAASRPSRSPTRLRRRTTPRTWRSGAATPRAPRSGTSSRATTNVAAPGRSHDRGGLPARADHHPVRRALPGRPDHP